MSRTYLAVAFWIGATCAGCMGAEGSLWKAAELPAQAAGSALRGVCFADATRGWIVGDKGLCLASDDGGKRWSAQATGSTATLRSVRFNDAQHGFACGDGDAAAPRASGHMVMGRAPNSGSLLSTSDGGKTWSQQWITNSFEIWCVETSAAPTLQAGNGWDPHLDGDILRSADGGKTWTERRAFRALSDIRAVDKQRWIAVGSPVSVGFTGAPKDPLLDAKACRALYSRDGGKTWSPSKGSDGSTCLRGLFARKGLALAVGDGGAILRSEDDGETWTAVKAEVPADLRAVAAAPDGAMILAGGARGVFAFSTDAGKTWKASWTGRAEALYAAAACGGTFWVAGANGTALSCDAKALAEAKNLPAPPPPPKEPERTVTAAQRARVRVGDYLIHAVRVVAPPMGMNLDFQVKMSVTAIKGDTYTLAVEVVKGTPPPGQPAKESVEAQMADLESFADWEIGKAREEKAEAITATSVRLPDETLEIGGKKVECLVIQMNGTLPGGAGTVAGKHYVCKSADVPISGMVKLESVQNMAMPTGAKVELKSSRTLVEWGRGKE